MRRIFFVGDGLSLISGSSSAIRKQRYEIDVARTKLETETLRMSGTYDLAILNVSLPNDSGYDLCRKTHQTSKVPVIPLTATDEKTDIVMGLDIGGNDYITRPFRLVVFLSWVNTFLRRSDNFNQADTKLSSSGTKIQLLEREIYKSGAMINLTASEYKLLCLFMKNPNIVLLLGQILGRPWGCDESYIGSSASTVYTRRLRTKIEDNPNNSQKTVTARRMGYKWNAED